MSEYLSIVLQNIANPLNILVMILGVALGIVVGALPGLNATLAVALLLPFTFGMTPEAGMLLLIGTYCAAIYGGSITAVLINTPGTPASVATAIDGYQMTKQGDAVKGLAISLRSSVIGGLLSGLALMFIEPLISKYALKFGPPEFFALTFFGLTIISSVSGKSIAKGLVMAGFGLLFSTVGLDAVEGLQRFLFNQDFLLGGISIVSALIGVFAVAEVFNQIEKRAKAIVSDDIVKLDKDKKYTWKEYLRLWPTILKSSIIGIIVGATPGTGGAIASFISYRVAKGTSKHPEKFGHGAEEGVCASETGNNATTGATLIPMMTLGIPGDTVTAIMLGALTIHGLRMGPQLFKTNGALVYTIIAGFFVVNILMYFEGKIAIKFFANIVKIPSSMLLPIILVLCLIGGFSSTNTIAGIGITLFFGIFGYVLGKFDFPMPPLLIALVLGTLTEVSFRQSMLISDNNLVIFFSRPIALIFILLGFASLFWSPVGQLVKALRGAKAKA